MGAKEHEGDEVFQVGILDATQQDMSLCSTKVYSDKKFKCNDYFKKDLFMEDLKAANGK